MAKRFPLATAIIMALWAIVTLVPKLMAYQWFVRREQQRMVRLCQDAIATQDAIEQKRVQAHAETAIIRTPKLSAFSLVENDFTCTTVATPAPLAANITPLPIHTINAAVEAVIPVSASVNAIDPSPPPEHPIIIPWPLHRREPSADRPRFSLPSLAPPADTPCRLALAA